MNIIEIKKEYNKKAIELRNLKHKIKEHEDNKEIPDLKKEYENKFFKTRTNYSCPEKPSDYWFIYQRVNKITSVSYCEITSFSIDKNGVILIEKDKYYFISMLHQEITEKEFYNKFDKLIDKIKSIKDIA